MDVSRFKSEGLVPIDLLIKKHREETKGSGDIRGHLQNS